MEIGGFEERKLKELDKSLTDKGLKAINIRTFDNFATAYQALRAGQTEGTVTIDSTGGRIRRSAASSTAPSRACSRRRSRSP